MATKSDFTRASWVIVNLEGLRRDMRANAFEYMARAQDGQPVDSLQALVNANGTQYVRRIKDWYQEERKDPVITKQMQDGLAIDPSVTLDMLDAMASKMLAAAQAEEMAQIVGYDDVIAVASATLSALPFCPFR